MSARVSRVGSFLLLSVALGCESDSSGPFEPSGPEPIVFASVQFGDPPVQGELVLQPWDETIGWRYTVDFEETGGPDRSGVLQGETRIPYRFDAPGLHVIVVELEGPEGRLRREVPVAVNDLESAFEIRGATQLLAGYGYEGIAIDHTGERLYLGAFGGNAIFSVRASDFGDLRGPLELQGSGVEGLSVAPGDSLLYAIHKNRPFSIVAIPSLELRSTHHAVGGYYVHPLDARTALTSGLFTLDVVNVVTGDVAASAGTAFAHHFALNPDRTRVALLHGTEVLLLDLPSLTLHFTINLTTLVDAEEIAFDPAGDRIYVIGRDSALDVRFVVLDAVSGFYLSDISLGEGGCGGLCVANPVATSISGRWVAFEQGNSLLVVDTETDSPRFRLGVEHPGFPWTGASVAADPQEDLFYVLSNSGLLQKVAIIE